MIWVWIGSALLLSCLLLKRRHVSLYNYIWAFVPIDMYGINIAGSTIKPYMLFALFIIALAVKRGKLVSEASKKALILPLLLIPLMFATDILNGLSMGSMLQHALITIIIICAICYLSLLEGKDSLRELLVSITTVGLAYGIVFTVACLLFSAGVRGFAIYTEGYFEPGMIVYHLDVSDGNVLTPTRLRGFYNDQNSLISMFVIPLAYSAFSLFSREDTGFGKKESLLTIAVIAYCIFYTNSRTAIAIFAFVVLAAIWHYAYESRMTVVFTLLTSLALIAILLLLTGVNLGSIEKNIGDLFYNRSSFNDTYGRGSIWRVNFEALINGPLLTGFGQNQVQLYSPLLKPCHNTWLEWLTGAGLIVGTYADLIFLVPGFYCIKTLLRPRFKTDYVALCAGYLALLIALTFVDFTMNTYLIFLCLYVYTAIGSNKELSAYTSNMNTMGMIDSSNKTFRAGVPNG